MILHGCDSLPRILENDLKGGFDVAQLKALLFDVDGTLADTERKGHRVAFNEAFKEAGLDWFWDEDLYGELLKVTGGKQRMRHYLDNFHEGPQPAGDVTQLIIDLHAAKNAHYQALLREGRIPLRNGVRRLIDEAREKGVIVAIATTTTPGNVTSLIESNLGKDAMDWFGVIAAGDMVPELKPAPDVFEYAMDKLGLGVEDCVALEDSRNGVRSARAAGLKTVVTVNGYTRDDDLSGADLIVSQFGEPDSPFEVLHGDAGDSSYVDVSLLEKVLAS